MWVGHSGQGQHDKGRSQLRSDFCILNVVVELVLSQPKLLPQWKEQVQGTSLQLMLCVIVPGGIARGYNILVFLMFFKTPAIQRS